MSFKNPEHHEKAAAEICQLLGVKDITNANFRKMWWITNRVRLNAIEEVYSRFGRLFGDFIEKLPDIASRFGGVGEEEINEAISKSTSNLINTLMGEVIIKLTAARDSIDSISDDVKMLDIVIEKRTPIRRRLDNELKEPLTDVIDSLEDRSDFRPIKIKRR